MQSATDVPQWSTLVSDVQEACSAELTLSEFTAKLRLNNGVTGYVYHTVPIVTYAWWLHYGDFQRTLEAVLDYGGDTDTTGAIAGALAGATVGENGIPESWLKGIVNWPRSVRLLHLVGDRLAQQRQTKQPFGSSFLLLARRCATKLTLLGSRVGAWISSSGSSILNGPAKSSPRDQCRSTHDARPAQY